MQNQENNKIITFRFATIEQLMEIVNIKKVINFNKFEEWFAYNYPMAEGENDFLNELIERNQLHLIYYNETKLTIKIIAPLLYKINFNTDKFTDWYESEISCELNSYTLKGKPDLIIATGISYPKIPYFFIQEYKKAINPTGNPEEQVITEMLAAMTLNKTSIIRGSYIVGQYWKFVILEKLETGNYQYYVSKAFDCLDFDDLKQIYINLQAVKHLYCK